MAAFLFRIFHSHCPVPSVISGPSPSNCLYFHFWERALGGTIFRGRQPSYDGRRLYRVFGFSFRFFEPGANSGCDGTVIRLYRDFGFSIRFMHFMDSVSDSGLTMTQGFLKFKFQFSAFERLSSPLHPIALLVIGVFQVISESLKISLKLFQNLQTPFEFSYYVLKWFSKIIFAVFRP